MVTDEMVEAASAVLDGAVDPAPCPGAAAVREALEAALAESMLAPVAERFQEMQHRIAELEANVDLALRTAEDFKGRYEHQARLTDGLNRECTARTQQISDLAGALEQVRQAIQPGVGPAGSGEELCRTAVELAKWAGERIAELTAERGPTAAVSATIRRLNERLQLCERERERRRERELRSFAEGNTMFDARPVGPGPRPGGRVLVFVGGPRHGEREWYEPNPDGLYPGSIGAYRCAGYWDLGGLSPVGVMLPSDESADRQAAAEAAGARLNVSTDDAPLRHRDDLQRIVSTDAGMPRLVIDHQRGTFARPDGIPVELRQRPDGAWAGTWPSGLGGMTFVLAWATPRSPLPEGWERLLFALATVHVTLVHRAWPLDHHPTVGATVLVLVAYGVVVVVAITALVALVRAANL